MDDPSSLRMPHEQLARVIERARKFGALPTAVVFPVDAPSLQGALESARMGLITPILVGPEAQIREIARMTGASVDGVEFVEASGPRQAAARAMQLVHEGRARAVMKGALHTDVLLHEVVKADGGLRTERKISHVFVMDVPGLDRLLFVTDAAVNIAPGLEEKRDIVQNAIDLAHALGVELPRVAVLSAVETVTARIPSTVDAAALSKMAERGQITGGLVDGPLAMDNAVNLEAAQTKGIHSAVAGHADILMVPNLEAGNLLVKELTFLAHAEPAGIVVGALVPVVLTSRADDVHSRLASSALAVLASQPSARGM